MQLEGARSHPGLQRVPLLYLTVQLPGVKGQLHLAQEAVVSEAVVVPDGDLQAARLQLRVADDVLLDTGEGATGVTRVHTGGFYSSAPVRPRRLAHPQVLVENWADAVGLDAGLPLALPGRVGQQVRLHVTARESHGEVVDQQRNVRSEISLLISKHSHLHPLSVVEIRIIKLLFFYIYKKMNEKNILIENFFLNSKVVDG